MITILIITKKEDNILRLSRPVWGVGGRVVVSDILIYFRGSSVLWPEPIILPLTLTWSNHSPLSFLPPPPQNLSRLWQILFRKTLLITMFKYTGELTKSNESWGWHFKYGNSRHFNKFSLSNTIFGPSYFWKDSSSIRKYNKRKM